MAQLTSVRLRVRADNSIDRCCSTDTAYPFQPYRGEERVAQADLYTGTRGRLASRRRVTAAAAGVGGTRGLARGGCDTRRRATVAVALQRSTALTLRSLTFPDDPR